MRTKTICLSLLFGATLALCSLAKAQDTALHAPFLNRKQMIEKRIAHMKKALDLSDAQMSQLKTIWQQNAEKMRADRQALQAAQGTNERKQAASQMKADGAALRKQMAAVLTLEQLAKFKKIRLQMVERRIHRLQRAEQRLKR